MATLTRKPLGWFKTAPQARRHFDEADLQRLGESLKVRQLQPVLARPDGMLITGERRYRAATLVGLKDLEVVIAEESLTETQIRVFQLTENVHRADLTDAEKWHACEELLKLNSGWTNKDLAQHLKLSESTVTKYLAPSRCTQAVQAALEAGRIGITSVYEISRASESSQGELLGLAETGTSRDGLAERVRKQRKAATPQVRQARVVCPLPTGTRIVVTGPEMDLEGLIEALQAALDAARKANKEAWDLKTAERVWKDKAKAG